MQTSAKIIAHSVSPDGVELYTVEGVLWRPVLAELNTHCDLSRNSASSRARSVKKTITEVEEDPAFPPEFSRERVGMAGGAPLTGDEFDQAQTEWYRAAKDAIIHAKNLVNMGVHKSIVNRLIEPFMWHTVVITATEWDNFFEQRLALNEDGSKAADPAMYDFALAVKNAMAKSTPEYLCHGEWHMPYITDDDWAYVGAGSAAVNVLKRISVARCAGTSYLTQGVEGRDHVKDLALYDRLRNANPTHWSPFEHIATPMRDRDPHDPAREAKFFKLYGWASLRWVEAQAG